MKLFQKSFLAKNKEILQSRYPGLYEEICTQDDGDFLPEDIIIDTAPAGDPTLCIKGMHVHSPRDPLREGVRLAETVSNEKGPVVILGFGLGYAAEAAAKYGRPVIVVEKNKSLLLKALELRDFSGFLTENRVIFIAGGTGGGITDALAIANEIMSGENAAQNTEKKPWQSAKEKPSVIRNKALMGLDEAQWYKSAEDKIRAWGAKDDINAATHKKFARRWVRNLLRNMSAVRDLPGISHLAGLAAEKNLPVFLAAAGPSLDKIKPLLGGIQERCIIVAVDTSLRFFINNGVEPDFVLAVDPQFWNCRHLDRCLPHNENGIKTALIAESAVYPPVLNLPFKNKFLCSSLFPLGAFIENLTCPKGRLGAGGSVASTAWDFARSLGGQEIWIAGLDLAFPDLKTHFRGARFEDISNSQSNRFNPVEKWVVRTLQDGIPFKSRSFDGGKVLTDRRLSLYAAWFEHQFRQNRQVQNSIFFPAGLAIAGLQTADIEKFLSLPNRRDEINSCIQSLFTQIESRFNDPAEKRERNRRYEDAVSVLESEIKKIRAAAAEGAEIARTCLQNGDPSQQDEIIKKLDEITRRLNESKVREIADFLIPPFEANDEKNPFNAYLKSSLKLFSGIINATQ
ncbi:MAG: DUF115 domain-containing protein [Treponema sp.]|nr:DUF115 domain-containing protein [Treponema sp.]